MKERIIKFFIDKAKRNKLIQSIFEQPLDLNQFAVEDTFHDSHGNKHNLYKGYRTKIKPGWEQAFNSDWKSYNKSPGHIEKIVNSGKIAVERLLPIIELNVADIKNSRILEIGCSTGATTFSFANITSNEVVGTEFSGYKIESIDNNTQIEVSDLNEVNEKLKVLRNLVKEKFSSTESKVKFIDDDICNSKLPKNSFDLICSWDVLEHIHKPLDAFKNIYNLLDEDGVAIHEYNPFFSLSGGHSPCTLDFPWGHVLLNNEDFKRFNEEKQSNRSNVALSFFHNGLNRMTINDLQNYCSESNLEIVSLLKFPKEQHLRMLNKDIFKLCKMNYPTVSIDDLVTPRIIVIMKKSSR